MNKEEILEIDILYRGWLGNREHCHLEKIDIYEFCKEYSDLQNQSLQKQLEEVKEGVICNSKFQEYWEEAQIEITTLKQQIKKLEEDKDRLEQRLTINGL